MTCLSNKKSSYRQQCIQMGWTVLLFSISLLFISKTVFAESFKVLGSRPLGMGGAFVAVAEDSLAQYWNPAGIARQKKFDVEIPANVRAEFTGGILKDVNTISDLATKYSAVKSAQTNGSRIDADQLSSLFTTVKTLQGLNQPDKGVLIEAQTGFNLRIMRLGLSINNFTSAGAAPFIDTVNIGLGSTSGQAGVSFTGANTATPAETDLVTARSNVQSAIDTVGYANVEKLVGASGLTAGGISNSQQLANALVNQSKSNGLTNDQILTASNQIKDNAPLISETVASAASGNSYSNNTSNVTLRGISLFEVGAGYSHRFFVEDLYLGGNLKILHGTVGFFRQQFLNTSVSGNDTFSNFDNNTFIIITLTIV